MMAVDMRALVAGRHERGVGLGGGAAGECRPVPAPRRSPTRRLADAARVTSVYGPCIKVDSHLAELLEKRLLPNRDNFGSTATRGPGVGSGAADPTPWTRRTRRGRAWSDLVLVCELLCPARVWRRRGRRQARSWPRRRSNGGDPAPPRRPRSANPRPQPSRNSLDDTYRTDTVPSILFENVQQLSGVTSHQHVLSTVLGWLTS